MTTPFGYLLNAMEGAAHEKDPAAHGYKEKRRAVLDYVRRLEQAENIPAPSGAARPGEGAGEPVRAALCVLIAAVEARNEGDGTEHDVALDAARAALASSPTVPAGTESNEQALARALSEPTITEVENARWALRECNIPSRGGLELQDAIRGEPLTVEDWRHLVRTALSASRLPPDGGREP